MVPMLSFGSLSPSSEPAVHVETNAAGAAPFWAALGYQPTGRVVPFQDGTVETTVAVWTRPVEV